jgi:hypothetical protein
VTAGLVLVGIWASDPTDEFDVVGTLTVERPKTPVWKTYALPDHIERIIQEQPVLSPSVVGQIVNCLESVVAESRRQERQCAQRSRDSDRQQSRASQTTHLLLR